MTNAAIKKLNDACERTGSLLSIGLEPAFDYLGAGFPQTLEGLEAFLREIISATDGLCPAYKVNLAFFEAHGVEGVKLLYRIRESLPANTILIADAKRGDIGSTAKQYAIALYDQLKADAATINPLMGFDSAEPFLAYEDRLHYFLVATSNPGASDFLLAKGLYMDIARAIQKWNLKGNCGVVCGATRPDQFRELREILPQVPMLVPGVGAQGGDLEATISAGRSAGAGPANMLIHVTRGILPGTGDRGDFAEIVHDKILQWNQRIAAALRSTP